MKINKIALGVAVTSLVAWQASAATDYYMYGSTAYRKSTFDAVKAILTAAGNSLTSVVGDNGANSPGTPGVYVDLSAAAAGSVGNNTWVFVGSIAGIGAVNIHGTWQGSVGGQSALTGSIHQPMLNPGAVGAACTYDSTHAPDVGMCDQQPGSVPSKLAPTAGFTGVFGANVAVIEFVIAGNAMKAPAVFPAQLNNVSGYQLRELYTIGVLPMGQVTGNPADNTVGIYAVGRDDDSGTRATFSMDTGLGIPSPLSQYAINMNGPGNTYQMTNFPVGGINFPNDGGGYASGGNVKTAMLNQNPGNYVKGDLNAFYAVAAETESIAICYIAVSDWNGTGLPLLNYDGVPFSNAAIQEGTYTYWGYENANIRSTDHVNNPKSINTFFSLLTASQQAQAGTVAAPGTLAISSMDCTRAGDGQAIAHN